MNIKLRELNLNTLFLKLPIIKLKLNSNYYFHILKNNKVTFSYLNY